MNMKQMMGKKIRELRLQKGMTQAALAGDTVTRNMLSQIENGLAQPSVATIVELAEKLGVPTEYFFSEETDLGVFRKMSAIAKIRRAFADGDYGKCIYRLDHLGVSDEETEYLYAKSFFGSAVLLYREGKLRGAREYFEKALLHAEKTHYVGDELLCAVHRYIAAIRFVCDKENVPDRRDVPDEIRDCMADMDYVRMLSGGLSDCDGGDCGPYDRHLSIRARMNDGDAEALIGELRDLLDGLDGKRYAVLRYFILSDMEALAQRVGDFKCAYECARERLSFTENC